MPRQRGRRANHETRAAHEKQLDDGISNTLVPIKRLASRQYTFDSYRQLPVFEHQLHDGLRL